MTLTWKCESPEPGRRGAAAPWTAEIGPVRLAVEEIAPGDWHASMSYPIQDRRGHKRAERSGWPTLGEAMEGAEWWARLTLEHWRDLGALARAALVAMDGP